MIVGYIRDGTARNALFTAARGEDSVLRCEAEFYLNETDRAKLTLPGTNRAARSLTQKNAVIELEDDGGTVFIGDVALTEQEDGGEIRVDLDGALGWLGTICKAPFQVREGDASSPVLNFLTAIIDQYNAAVSTTRMLHLGAVTVTGNVVMDHHDEYVTMLDLLSEVREQLGGYVYIDYASGIPVLNYIAQPEAADGQDLEFGRNVLTVVNQLDFSSYASRVYVAGTDENDQLITSVATDETAEATFGRVDVSLRGEGKTAEEIYAEALAELAARKAPLQNLTMTAADLAEIGHSERLFTIGSARRAYCEQIGIDTKMIVRKIKRDYLNRKNSEVSFGRDVSTLSGASGSTRGGSIGGGGVYVLPESVLYTPMTLTAAEKEQARLNIGAAAAGDIPTTAGAVMYSIAQSLTEAQKAQARQNIGVSSGGDVEINFPVHTPQDYGAVADGVTDDTEAVQAALNADGAVFFPAGTYLVNALTVTHDSTRLYGCGDDSVIKLSGGSTNLLTATKKNDLLIESLCFDASDGTATTDASTGSVSGADAIRLERCENAVIRDVTANKAPKTGIFSSNCKNLLIEKCTANESEHYAGIAVATSINADAKEHSASIENGNFRFDGASQFVFENSVFTVQNPIFLFACNENGAADHYSNGIRIKSAEFSRSGSTVANFVPRIRNSDGELGMLETISGVFFTNDGEGSFKNDSASVGSGTYTEIDYIESDGASYIDTGILPSADLDVVVRFSHASIDSITLAARQYVFGSYSRDGENAVVGRYQFYCSGSENSGISFAGWGGGGSEVGFRNFWVTADVNASILDCVCCDNDLDGILCVSPNTVIARCVCNRNGIAKNPGDKVACGIYLSKRSYMTVKDCVVNNNYAFGIEGNDIFNCKILDNSICNNRLSGIHCYAQLNNPSFNNVISHNSCIGNARGQTEFYGGILLSAFGAAPSTDCRYNIISENTCKGNKYGLIIRYTDHTKLLDNITTDNEVDVHLHANTNYQSLDDQIKEAIQDSSDLIESIADAEIVEQLYETLDYIESDGASYIDTGIIPSATTRITARFKMASTAAYNTAARQYVFGTYDLENGSAESRVQFFYGGSDSGQRSFAGFGASTQYTALTPDADEHLVTMNADSIVFDSGAWVKTFDSIVFTNPRPIYLFACNEDGTVDHFSKGMQIMAVSIYNGNTRIARLVPALRKADGALGMLDEDSGEFFPNMGTGTFRNDTVEPPFYNVTLNADGTVNTFDSALTYSAAAASVLNGKSKTLIVTWGNTLFTADADEKLSGANGDVKFIADVEHDGIQRHMIFTLTSSSILTTTLIETYSRVPAVIYRDATGLAAIEANMSASPAWQLTGLNLSPFRRIKIWTKAAQKSGTTASASTTPSACLEMLLDPALAIAAYGNHYLASTVIQKSNDNNRLATLTCAVSSDKTSFAVLRQTNLYGTAATNNNDVGSNVVLIEGYYD